MTTATTEAVREFTDLLPDAAKDVRLNLNTVLKSDALEPAQAYGVALACALHDQPNTLVAALRQDGVEYISAAIEEDARAAAALMAMNNVYYRFRHMVGKEVYNQMPAKLRMTRIARPATDKATFELFSLAVSALNGCEMCVRSHEAVLAKHGVSEAAIHDAVRIAAVVRSAIVASNLTAA